MKKNEDEKEKERVLKGPSRDPKTGRFVKGGSGGPGRGKKKVEDRKIPDLPESSEERIEYAVGVFYELSQSSKDENTRLRATQAIAKLEMSKGPEKGKQILSPYMASLLSGDMQTEDSDDIIDIGSDYDDDESEN